MRGLLEAVALMFGVVTAGLTVAALVAGIQAVRIGGARLLFSGWDWFVPSQRVPQGARPFMRSALRRWGGAAACMVLAAVTSALSRAMP